MLWRRGRSSMRYSAKCGGGLVGRASQANGAAHRKALRQERAGWGHPSFLSLTLQQQQWSSHCPLKGSTMMPELDVSPLSDLSLLSISYRFCLSRYHAPTSFPKVLSTKSPLVWNLFYFTALCSLLVSPSGIYLIIQRSVLWATCGRGICFGSLLSFGCEASPFGHSLFLWQSHIQTVVPDQKPQWCQRRTSNWFTKGRVFEKLTMPNHKFMGLWTGRQDSGTLQASFAC